MKLGHALGATIVAGALALGACGGEGSGGAGAGGGGGGGGSGGAVGGGGGLGGSGGGTSPGSVTLKFEVPTTKTYCVSTDTCSAVTSIVIKDSTGTALGRFSGDCYTDCTSCEMLPCPGYACQQQGMAVTGETLEWDGSYWAASSCGSPQQQCTGHFYAAAGSYTAVMCATPGDLVPDATSTMQCTNTGAAECVEVPFEFPSSQTYTGTLPG
jgi:hypothetical protein